MLVAVALSSVSCLDKMPEDGIPFDESLQTVSDINLAVIGIYDAFRSKYLYSGNLTLLPDIQTDLVYGVNGNTNVYGDIWRWKEIKPTNTDIEAIWKVGFTVNAYGGALGQVFANYDYSTLRPDYVPATWAVNLYDMNDLRVSAFFQSFTTGYSHGLTWPLLIKYFGNESFTNYNILHVSMPKVLRLSEQYLIRAEAYVQCDQPDYGKAGSDISVLRTARYSSYGGSTSLNKENAMDVIEQERVKELYMEGFRLHDLKRWHKGFERTPQDQSLSNGSSLKVEKDDPLFVWPIPQHELDAPGSEVEPNESNK